MAAQYAIADELDTSEPMSAAEFLRANQILGGFAKAQSLQAAAVQRAEYVELLRTMDWQYEFSDDHRAVVKGREQIRRIRALQPYVDADRAMFDAARPGRHGDANL